MTPKYFKGHNVVFAKDQPEYLQLPARNSDGLVTFCWGLSWKERIKILITGEVWQQVLTFNNPLQRQKLSCENPLKDSEVQS